MDNKNVKQAVEAFIWVSARISMRAETDHELNDILQYMMKSDKDHVLVNIINLDALSIVSDYPSFEEKIDLLCIKLRKKYRELVHPSN
jgi:hypothetical protein